MSIKQCNNVYVKNWLGEPEDGVARYRLTVSDNGIGMSEEFQKHLFESFSREDSSEVSKEEGTGLGLAIVKRIIDIVGGTISVSSRKGVGSTFVVELPLEVMDEEAIEGGFVLSALICYNYCVIIIIILIIAYYM